MALINTWQRLPFRHIVEIALANLSPTEPILNCHTPGSAELFSAWYSSRITPIRAGYILR